MAQCPNCHSEVKSDERFCGNCGARIEPQTPPAPPRPTGKETIVLPAVSDTGLNQPQPATPPSRPPADATLIAPPRSQQPDQGPGGIPGQIPTAPSTPPQIGGYPGGQVPPPVMPQPPQKSGGSSVWKILGIIAGLGALACIALAIGGYLFLQRVGNSTGQVFATISAGLETAVVPTSAALRPTRVPRPTTAPTAAEPTPADEPTPAEEPTSAAEPTAEPSTGSPGAVLLRDPFDNATSSNFDEGETENASYKFVDGTYQMTVKKPQLIVWKTVRGDYGNAAISVDATISGIKESATGLVFHYQDDRNFYIFTVTGEGRYALDVYKDDNLNTLIDWTESPAINPLEQNNNLRVETAGDKIRLYANDQLLDEVSDSTIARGKAAIAVNTFDEPNATVKFDNLVIRGIK